MTKIIRRFAPYMLLCSVAMAQGLTSQPTVHAGFSPVPIWPQNGIVSDTLGQQQYVFYDPSTNEVVLNVPENAAVAENGLRKQIRFTLRSGTDPIVSVHIQPTQDGKVLYRYSLENGSHARQPLDAFALLVPGEPQMRASHPFWTTTMIATDQSSRLPSPNSNRLVQLQWSSESSGALPKSSSLYGFQVVSAAKPGFVTSVAQGEAGKPYSEVLEQGLSEPAKAQLKEILQPRWNGNLRVILGPKFQVGTPQIIVAADFYTGIQMLVKRKLLSENSPFIISTLQTLDSFLQNSGQVLLDPSAINTATAQPGVEQEIAAALKLSLGQ